MNRKLYAIIFALFGVMVVVSLLIKLLLQIRVDAQMMQEDLEEKDREFEIAMDKVGKDPDKVEYIPPSGAPKPNVDPLPNEN